MALDYKTEYRRYQHYFTYLRPFFDSPVTRAYFTVIASLVAIAIFAAFALRPTFTTMVTLNREINDKEALSRQLDAKINALSALNIDYQAVASSLPLVDLALPSGPEVTQILNSLQKTASASSVKLESLSLSKIAYEPTATSSALVAPVTVILSGNYPGLRSFLNSLGNLPRLFTVGEMAIVSNSPNVSVRLVLNAYYFP